MLDTPSSPFSTIHRLHWRFVVPVRHSTSPTWPTILHVVVVCGDTVLRRPCSRLHSSSQSEVSCYSSSALSSIRQLPPGSVIPSRIVAEPFHILFDDSGVPSSPLIQQLFNINRHFASVPGVNSGDSSRVVPAVLNSSSLFSSTMSNSIDQLYEVPPSRTPSTHVT